MKSSEWLTTAESNFVSDLADINFVEFLIE